MQNWVACFDPSLSREPPHDPHDQSLFRGCRIQLERVGKTQDPECVQQEVETGCPRRFTEGKGFIRE